MANVGYAAFSPLTALGGDYADGLASFSELTASGSGGPSLYGLASFEEMTSEGSGRQLGGVGVVSFEIMTSTGEAVARNFGSGTGSFEAMTAAGGTPSFGLASFEEMTSTGYGRSHNIGVASFEAMYAKHSIGTGVFQVMLAAGAGGVILSSVYAVKVMNTRTSAVTEYTNYDFNSFARIGGSWYGAGPDGIVRLDGATDDGDDINWVVRTGQHDDGDPGLKRLPEVLLSLRSSGKVRVRVYPDDNAHYDYDMARVLPSTIHTHRVVVGKGLRGRYFMVELRGVNNSDIELDSMQILMTKTTRRLG